MEIIWITNPDNYDPIPHQKHRKVGARRMELFAEHGFPVRVVHACDVVAGWDGRPRLWHQGNDLLDPCRGFMMSSWSWNPDAAQHFRVISRTIRASNSVLLNEALHDPERLGADKLAMYQHAGNLGVPVLPVVAVPFGRYAGRAVHAVRCAFGDDSAYVVKPRELAMGFGVLKVDSLGQLKASFDLLAASGLGCIVQPYLPHTGDLRVYVHQGEAVATLLRQPEADAYQANLSKGGSVGPQQEPPEVLRMSERLARSVAADYLCVDWLLTPSGPVFNEWMTVAAAFEDLPEPQRGKVATALFTFIGKQLGVANALILRPPD